ncbi:MAG: divalent-cation tolerance protein CutA [Candidatus Gracilibacteria bacterium]|nr:divalent-cation tolerance protein CutA [Candidatus Gracilibacteria bacterium]
MKKIISIYTTFSSIDEAKSIIQELLERKFIACGNTFTVESYYVWENNIENSSEIASILKTRSENWEKIKNFILEKHSYEIPCIVKYEIEANESYVDWVYDETI